MMKNVSFIFILDIYSLDSLQDLKLDVVRRVKELESMNLSLLSQEKFLFQFKNKVDEKQKIVDSLQKDLEIKAKEYLNRSNRINNIESIDESRHTRIREYMKNISKFKQDAQENNVPRSLIENFLFIQNLLEEKNKFLSEMESKISKREQECESRFKNLEKNSLSVYKKIESELESQTSLSIEFQKYSKSRNITERVKAIKIGNTT